MCDYSLHNVKTRRLAEIPNRASPGEVVGSLTLGGTIFNRIRAQQIRSDFIRRLWHAE